MGYHSKEHLQPTSSNPCKLKVSLWPRRSNRLEGSQGNVILAWDFRASAISEIFGGLLRCRFLLQARPVLMVTVSARASASNWTEPSPDPSLTTIVSPTRAASRSIQRGNCSFQTAGQI